jgi:hypothetical protein
VYRVRQVEEYRDAVLVWPLQGAALFPTDRRGRFAAHPGSENSRGQAHVARRVQPAPGVTCFGNERVFLEQMWPMYGKAGS